MHLTKATGTFRNGSLSCGFCRDLFGSALKKYKLMESESVKIKSLKEHVLESISSILFSEKFPSCDFTPEGILALVDEIASYHEEGKELFPHILITTNLAELLKSIPSVHKIQINSTELCAQEFSSALKLCAPLAVDSWIVFFQIDVESKKLQYGLLSSELSETSPSIHRQLIGDMSSDIINIPFIYISNIGQRTVLIEGSKNKVAVSLSLKGIINVSNISIHTLAINIAKNCKKEIQDNLIFYFEKLLNTALNECHGTLVAVVEDDTESINLLKNCLKDGTYLEETIDISVLVENSENEKSREASTLVRIYSSIIRNMLNFDGITIFSTGGKVIGYHCFVKQEDSPETTNGARFRAFDAMVNSKAFVCCLYKSQDGDEKIWSKHD